MPKNDESMRLSVNDKTLDDAPLVDEFGDNTDKLSDVSEHDEADEMLYATHRATTWVERLAPLLRNPCVRAFAIVNIFLILLNVIILVVVIVLGVITACAKSENSRMLAIDQPCLYKWDNWGNCSDSCDRGQGNPPNMTRKIISGTIVQARGKYMTQAPCPPNLENMVDYAPCNTHRCARPLSEFSFVGPFPTQYDNPGSCYLIRNLTRGDYLVKIDTAEITRPSACNGFAQNIQMLG